MSELIIIGEVATSYGYHGEMKIRPFTDFPMRFLQMQEVFLCFPGGQPVKKVVEKASVDGNRVILKLQGIATPEEVKSIRGALLQVSPEDLCPLPEGHYYIFEIIGLAVYTEEGSYLGKIVDVLTPGGNDVYVVNSAEEKAERKKDILLPAIKDVVKKIDLENKKMVVHLLPGLIEGGSS